MQEILYLSIAIGLVLSLVSVEFFGVILGGFFVPGYLAMHITKPLYILHVYVIAMITVIVVRALSGYMIIYGRKMLVMSVLIGYLLNLTSGLLNLGWISGLDEMHFGIIIPGLLAYWMQRQGIIETMVLSITGTVMTRFILTIVVGGALSL